jgi:hypothetical protein
VFHQILSESSNCYQLNLCKMSSQIKGLRIHKKILDKNELATDVMVNFPEAYEFVNSFHRISPLKN